METRVHVELWRVIHFQDTTYKLSKNWVNQVYSGKTSTDRAKGSDVKNIPSNVKDNSNDNYQSIERQCTEDNGGIENECDSQQVNP